MSNEEQLLLADFEVDTVKSCHWLRQNEGPPFKASPFASGET